PTAEPSRRQRAWSRPQTARAWKAGPTRAPRTPLRPTRPKAPDMRRPSGYIPPGTAANWHMWSGWYRLLLVSIGLVAVCSLVAGPATAQVVTDDLTEQYRLMQSDWYVRLSPVAQRLFLLFAGFE